MAGGGCDGDEPNRLPFNNRGCATRLRRETALKLWRLALWPDHSILIPPEFRNDDWWRDYVDLYVIHRARCVRSFTSVLKKLVPQTHGTSQQNMALTPLQFCFSSIVGAW